MRTLSQMSWLVMLPLLFGCEQEEAPPPTSQITESPEKNLVALNIGRGQRPDGRAILTLGVATADTLPVSGLSELTPAMQTEAMAVFNSTTAPCSPCMEEGASLSDCLLRKEATCENLQALSKRIVDAAAQGRDRHQIQPRVTYADPWKSSMSGHTLAGVGSTPPLGSPVWGDVSAPMSVVLVVDYADPFSRQMGEVWRSLVEGRDVAVYLMHLPHERHPEGNGLTRGVVAAGEHAGALHTALLEEGLEEATWEARAARLGLDEAAWSVRRGAAETTAVLNAHARLAAALEIEATPATLVNGYPVVGVRSLEFLQSVLNQEIADLAP